MANSHFTRNSGPNQGDRHAHNTFGTCDTRFLCRDHVSIGEGRDALVLLLLDCEVPAAGLEAAGSFSFSLLSPVAVEPAEPPALALLEDDCDCGGLDLVSVFCFCGLELAELELDLDDYNTYEKWEIDNKLHRSRATRVGCKRQSTSAMGDRVDEIHVRSVRKVHCQTREHMPQVTKCIQDLWPNNRTGLPPMLSTYLSVVSFALLGGRCLCGTGTGLLLLRLLAAAALLVLVRNQDLAKHEDTQRGIDGETEALEDTGSRGTRKTQ